eukprot:maker-scaffold_22-snap-gene-0.2-mRNA-1 protein AED:0.02 eAED:0.02 QI:0/0/0/1/1/1/3/0/669
MRIWKLLFVSEIVHFVSGTCGNGCSKHGTCVYGSDSTGSCQCDDSWNASEAADCSLRVCPASSAWQDHAQSVDLAHRTAECSNRGVCDRSSGTCTCDSGFEGSACERMYCPNHCNHRGRCLSMREAAEEAGYTYDLWDADKIYGCICDSGYFGYDCSLVQCPFGLEHTSGAVNEKQTISCTCPDSCTGKIILKIFEKYVKLEPWFSEATIEAGFANQAGIIVEATLSGGSSLCDNDGVDTLVEFTQDRGDIDLMTVALNELASTGLTPTFGITTTTDGAGSVHECSRNGQCDHATGICTCESNSADLGGTYNAPNCETASISPSACFEGLSQSGSQEDCSGRGICDVTTFKCTCNSGYKGDACEWKTCPTGSAWFDVATGDNIAHATAECSNRGTCTEITGSCSCQTGFSGDACETLSCPNVCSSKGTCFTMKELAVLAEDEVGVSLGITYGDPVTASTWDAEKIKGCYCDRDYYKGVFARHKDEYTGYDCSLISCAYGQNPSLLGRVNEIQSLTCTASAGSFKIQSHFYGSSERVAFDDLIANLQTALDLVTNSFGLIVASFEDSTILANEPVCKTSDPKTILLSFKTYGDHPNLNIDSTSLTGSIVIAEHTKGTTTGSMCSSQGICDTTTGFCTCFPNYYSSDGDYGVQKYGDTGDCSAINNFPTLS